VFLLFLWRDSGLLFDLDLAGRCDLRSGLLVRPSAWAGWVRGASSFDANAAQRGVGLGCGACEEWARSVEWLGWVDCATAWSG
jgi:hypothetical protein